MPEISSPCRDICRLHEDVCIGCKRTAEEIARWSMMEEPERLQIMAELDERPDPTPPD
jgi:predicted Fe-S protein YdhL (DUF1289 family)